MAFEDFSYENADSSFFSFTDGARDLGPVSLEAMEEDRLDRKTMLVFPEPGDYPIQPDICLITEGIPLQLLYSAYLQGVFPWFSEDDGEPVVWYSPNPRFCLLTKDLHVPKSLDKFLKKSPYTYTMDMAFERVMLGCRDMERKDQDGTWIGKKMLKAYVDFYREGFAHSIEVWHEGRLVGGLYGVLIGSVFFGESMFTLESDSAKSAFVLLARAFAECGGMLIDSQVYTDNIARFGAEEISRKKFLEYEKKFLFKPLQKDLKGEFRNSVEKYYRKENLPK